MAIFKKRGCLHLCSLGREFSGLDEHYIRFTISNQQEMDYVLTLLERFQKEN